MKGRPVLRDGMRKRDGRQRRRHDRHQLWRVCRRGSHGNLWRRGRRHLGLFRCGISGGLERDDLHRTIDLHGIAIIISAMVIAKGQQDRRRPWRRSLPGSKHSEHDRNHHMSQDAGIARSHDGMPDNAVDQRWTVGGRHGESERADGTGKESREGSADCAGRMLILCRSLPQPYSDRPRSARQCRAWPNDPVFPTGPPPAHSTKSSAGSPASS